MDHPPRRSSFQETGDGLIDLASARLEIFSPW